jgi:hypothetical protein
MILLKELAVGLIMGLILGVLIYARSAFLPPGVPPIVALVVGASLVFVILFSTLIGAALPLILPPFWDRPDGGCGAFDGHSHRHHRAHHLFRSGEALFAGA